MLASLRTAAVFGVEACPVHVEVDVSFGFPVVHDGRPAGRQRAREPRPRASAIRNSGFEFPPHRITVNLAPADVRKAGAVVRSADRARHPRGAGRRRAARDRRPRAARRAVARRIDPADARRAADCRGGAARRRWPACCCPRANASEAAIVAGLDVLAVSSLADAVRRAERSGETSRPRPPTAVRLACPSAALPPRSGGRPRTAAGAPRARDRRGRRPQPAARRPAGRRQDDDGAAGGRHPAAARRSTRRSRSRRCTRSPACCRPAPAC